MRPIDLRGAAALATLLATLLLGVPLAKAQSGLIQGLYDGAPACLLASVEQGVITPLAERLPPETGPRDWWVADLEGVFGQNVGSAPTMAECGCLEQPIVSLAPRLQLEGPAAASNLPLSLPVEADPAAADGEVYVEGGARLELDELEAGTGAGSPDACAAHRPGGRRCRRGAAGRCLQRALPRRADPERRPLRLPAAAPGGRGPVQTTEIETWWNPAPSRDLDALPEGPAEILPVALFDADGDGMTELVVAIRGCTRSYAWTLYQLQGDRLREVARLRAGAADRRAR